mgnify:CR=1 FL=1
MMKTLQDPWLLTPGPLTTSLETKQSMLHDWGSRDSSFIEMNTHICETLLNIINGRQSHVCVPIQGSGTFAVEATLSTLIPKTSKSLILINGAYGRRMAQICDYTGHSYEILETPEDTPPDLKVFKKKLLNKNISYVLLVYCETTSGIINPIDEIAHITKTAGRKLIVDAMSIFGATPIDAQQLQFEAIMASSNKCLEGVPGLGFSLIKRTSIEMCKGNSHSLSLDLYDQWQYMEKNKQWRFTPPTHVIAAFDTALKQFMSEGGVKARKERYQNNCQTLISGMRKLGFETLLDDNLQAPIIVTFKMPKNPLFIFESFYNRLKDHGYIIYPGKLTVSPSFRIGCIGNIDESVIHSALKTIKVVLDDMGISNKVNLS